MIAIHSSLVLTSSPYQSSVLSCLCTSLALVSLFASYQNLVSQRNQPFGANTSATSSAVQFSSPSLKGHGFKGLYSHLKVSNYLPFLTHALHVWVYCKANAPASTRQPAPRIASCSFSSSPLAYKRMLLGQESQLTMIRSLFCLQSITTYHPHHVVPQRHADTRSLLSYVLFFLLSHVLPGSFGPQFLRQHLPHPLLSHFFLSCS